MSLVGHFRVCVYVCLYVFYVCVHVCVCCPCNCPQRIHTGERPFQCAHCDYRARAKSTLITHERVHDVDKPYKPRTPRVTGGDDKLLKCPHCDYTAGRSNMIKHERIHSGAWFFDVSPFSVAPVLCCAVLIHRCSFVPRGRAVVVVWLDVVVVALECCVVV